MVHLHLRILSAVVIAFALCGTSRVGASTIAYDPFTDGGRTDGTDSLDVNWYRLANTTTLTVGADGVFGSTALTYAPGGTFRPIVALLPSTVSLTTLGDYIELTFRFRFASTPGNQAGGLRFGFESDNGTVVTGDENTFADPGAASPVYTNPSKNDIGYYFNLSTGTTVAHQVWRENGGTAAPLGGTDRVQLGADATTPTFAADTLAHTGALRITRTATGVDIAAGIDGTTYITRSDTAAGFYTNFNEVLFNTANNNISLVLDNVQVDAVVAVPEPSTWALLAAGLTGAIIALRRRLGR